MKIKSECIPCMINRSKFECDLAFKDDEDGKIGTLAEVLRFLGSHCEEDLSPAFFGTYRDRIVKWRTNNKDYYYTLKKEANESAKKILPLADKLYEESNNKFEALMRIAAAANSVEYGIKDHTFSNKQFEEEFYKVFNENLIGNLDKVEEAIRTNDKILYLLDNSGEIVFDKFVIDKLEEMEKEVVLSPKDSPVLNDATVDDVEELGFTCRIVPSGHAVGVLLDEANEDFLEYLWNPDYLIIAKGMGNYETISSFEYKFIERLIYILRVKCYSVANNNNVPKGSLITRLVIE